MCTCIYQHFHGKIWKLHIYPYIRNISTFYCRLDEIVSRWNGTEFELIEFIGNLNKKHTSIKFEFTYWIPKSTKFKMEYYGNKWNNIYRQPNDRHIFLHYDSSHPKNLKDNIQFSQALGIKRICSEISEAIWHFKSLKDASIKRNYKPELLNYHFERALCVDGSV